MKRSIQDSNSIIQEDLLSICNTNLPWEKLVNKTIIISGGDGFLGSYLVKTFLIANYLKNLDLNIICIARKPAAKFIRLNEWITNPYLSIVHHDISNPLPDTLPYGDIVIHCASQASPKYYGIDPVGTLSANTLGTMHLLNRIKLLETSRFLFFSSGEIYGEFNYENHSISEKMYGVIDPLDIRSCYAESKRMGENICASWAHQFNLHTGIVRPFHTYGPGIALNDGRVFADFIADVLSRRDISIKSDGSSKRAFCYITDAITGFLTVLLKGEKGEAYNVANPEAEISVLDLAKLLASKCINRDLNVSFNPTSLDDNYLKSNISRATPSIKKIINLGWQPKIDLDEGFTRTLKSYY